MNKQKELELRKAVGDKHYYKKKLEDDRMTLKIIRILAVLIVVSALVIVPLSAVIGQYGFTIGWSVFSVVMLVLFAIEWHIIAKRRDVYLEAYNKNEIVKEKPQKNNTQGVKIIKPKK